MNHLLVYGILNEQDLIDSLQNVNIWKRSCSFRRQNCRLCNIKTENLRKQSRFRLYSYNFISYSLPNPFVKYFIIGSSIFAPCKLNLPSAKLRLTLHLIRHSLWNNLCINRNWSHNPVRILYNIVATKDLNLRVLSIWPNWLANKIFFKRKYNKKNVWSLIRFCSRPFTVDLYLLCERELFTFSKRN